MKTDDSSLDLRVDDTVEMDDVRYEVVNVRSVTLGRSDDEIDIYDLQSIDPNQDTHRSRPVSAAYLIYRLEAGEAAIATDRSIGQRLLGRARRSLR